jgi:hypothetical protein
MWRAFLTVSVLASILSAAAEAWAAIAIQIVEPRPDALADGTLLVRATVTSDIQVTSATARIASEITPLQREVGTTWFGAVSLSGVSQGRHVLAVTATDASASSATAEVSFVHDRKPVVTVDSPLPDTVARPNIRVRASCSDGDQTGCVSIQVGIIPLGSPSGCPGQVLFTRGTTVDEDLSLLQYANSFIHLCVVGTDTAGQQSSRMLDIYVDPSPSLYEVESVPGRILDADDTRILYRHPSDSSIRMKRRGVAQETAGVVGTDGRLFGTGFLHWPDGDAGLHEWKDGQSTKVGDGVERPPSVRVDRAAWITQEREAVVRVFGGPSDKLAPGVSYTSATVAGNGDVLLTGAENTTGSTTFGIWRYANGIVARIRACSGQCRQALSDGRLVVYRVMGLQEPSTTYLMDDAGDKLLGTASFASGPAVAKDWIAYEHQSRTGVSMTPRQVFVRAPNGDTNQLSIWETNSAIDSINGSGEVMVLNRDRRYRARPGQSPEAVSSALGRAHWLNGEWHIVIGRSLFRLTPAVSPGDAGTDVTTVPMDAGGGADHLPRDAPAFSDAPDGGTSPTDGPDDPSDSRMDGGAGPGGGCACGISRPVQRDTGSVLVALLSLAALLHLTRAAVARR